MRRDKYEAQMMHISNKKEREEEKHNGSFSNAYYWCLGIYLGKTLMELIGKFRNITPIIKPGLHRYKYFYP